MLRLAKDMAKAALDDSGLPYQQRLKMTRRGFKPSNYVLYDIGTNDLDDYAPDRYWRALGDSSGRSANLVLGNKLLFHLAFAGELPLARLFGYIARGHLMDVPGTCEQGAPPLAELLEREGALVVKPLDGQKGKHVHLLGSPSPGEFLLDGRSASSAELAAWQERQDGMLVNSRVQQTEYAARIFPATANTIRVLTVVDDEGPFVLCACHRFGRVRTGPVDNFAAGGLLCSIDLDSGVMSRALSNPGKGERTRVWHDTHPDTGAAIAGTEVPGFGALVDLLLNLLRKHSYLAYVGWDAVMTYAGPVFLEANCGSGLQLQAFTPFMRNPRFARFMRDRGMAPDAPR